MHRAEEFLSVEGVTKGYRSGERRLEVLSACDLQVAAGERIAIIGQSGVGKSTLLHLLAGLDRPDSGSVRFRGRELDLLSEPDLAVFRGRHVGLVFQFYHLLPEFSALENIMMPALIGGIVDGAYERAAGLLADVGLADRADHFPSELSGGERQRVAIARALIREPELILADEPTGNLDLENGRRVLEIFFQLNERLGNAMILVTHNPELVADFDRVMTMESGGRLREQTSGVNR
jgi:lipoprotein-releasing system ATP-binding protein